MLANGWAGRIDFSERRVSNLRTGRHEATRPFIFHIAAISSMEIHKLDTSHYSYSFFAYWPAWSHKTFYISNCCYFTNGISHIRHFIFSRSGRHEATRPFIFQIAAISQMEFLILDTLLHIKIETRKLFWPRSGPIKRRVWSGSDLFGTLVVIFILIRLNKFLPTSVACWWHSPTDWTQIRLDTTLGLIWFQTVWHSDCNIRHYWTQ